MSRLFLLAICALSACLKAEPFMELRLQGELRSDGQGPVELWLMHQSYGEGGLETQFAVIATTELPGPAPLDWTVLVPLDTGHGLSLYGWQDENGDGAHCLPGTGIERAGTVLVSEEASPDLWIDLDLTPSCSGPY